MIYSRRHAFISFAAASCAAVTAVFIAASFFGRDDAEAPDAAPVGREPVDFAAAPAAGLALPPVVEVPEASPAPAAPAADPGKNLRTRFRYVGPLGLSAVIEDLSTGKQKGYYVGMELEPGAKVAEVRARSVVLDTASGQVVLVSGGAASQAPAENGAESAAASALPELTPFQKRIGWQKNSSNEWSVSQSGLLGYYAEVLSRKERIGAVFDTLEPLRNESGKIEGYKVNIVGEKDFFEAVNFHQGDIVRSVNGIPMTNRRAAEKLVLRFAARDLDFVVIDMERDGETIQQIYYVDP